MSLTDIISDSVSTGVTSSIEEMMAGNATNETVMCLDTALTTKPPFTQSLGDFSDAFFYLAIISILLYYIITSIFKEEAATQIKNRYFSLENEESRAPGAILVMFGETLYIMTNLLSLTIVAMMIVHVDISSLFVSPSTLFIFGFYGMMMLIFIALGTIFLLLTLAIYSVLLVSGFILVKTLGLVLFFNPYSKRTKSWLRLFWANQFFTLLLIVIMWFVQIAGAVFGYSIMMAPFFTLLITLASPISMYIIYTLAWDWNWNSSKNRYNRNVAFVRNGIKSVIISKGNPVVAAGAVATSKSDDTEMKRGVQERIEVK